MTETVQSKRIVGMRIVDTIAESAKKAENYAISFWVAQ